MSRSIQNAPQAQPEVPHRVLLGISGGIAAYKAAELVRRLRERGYEVRCALTRNAPAFVAPLTLEVLSGHSVYREEYLEASGSGRIAGADAFARSDLRAAAGERENHELHLAAAAWAEVFCLAPATAHLLARLALGLADDFLTTACLAFTGPFVVAPAMHQAMWEKPAVQEHVATLRRRGVRFAGPVAGPLASGEVGMGRMAEPEAIVREVESLLAPGPLAGRKVLVTAGPTQEPVDPVRFLGNRSSGKMGFAIAEEAARRGASVVLIAGPVALPTPPRVTRVDVKTACEMEQAVLAHAGGTDLVVMAAAVADFRPAHPSGRKIKKAHGSGGAADAASGAGLQTIELVENPDILAGLRRRLAGTPRRGGEAAMPVLAGFAAETEDLEANARAKLAAKGVDFLVANDVSRDDIAFGSDTNEVTVFTPDRPPLLLGRRSKSELAADLLDLFTPELRPHELRAIHAG